MWTDIFSRYITPQILFLHQTVKQGALNDITSSGNSAYNFLGSVKQGALGDISSIGSSIAKIPSDITGSITGFFGRYMWYIIAIIIVVIIIALLIAFGPELIGAHALASVI